MRVWLIAIGEPLPTDSGGNRLLRAGMFANHLATQGHEVLWWADTFNHTQKIQRADKDLKISVQPNYDIFMLHSIPYRKNISLARVANHIGVALKFAKLSKREKRPDVILCSMPTLELSLAATSYGKKMGVPVVLDIRDLWPDLFLDGFPAWSHGFVRAMLFPFYWMIKRSVKDAFAISGSTQAYIQWALEKSNRTKTELDKDFPFGYSTHTPNEQDIEAAKEFWRQHGIEAAHKHFIVCFFGAISHQFDLKTVIQTARLIKSKDGKIKFVLCGTGERLDDYKTMAHDCPNVIFPGWVSRDQIWVLMRMSSVGLAPYVNVPNFELNLPNKVIEYFSAGLPVGTSLNGVLGGVLQKHRCGLSYRPGDAEHLASILCELEEPSERRNEMSRNAISLYRERYVAEKIYAEMTTHLQTIVESYKKD